MDTIRSRALQARETRENQRKEEQVNIQVGHRAEVLEHLYRVLGIHLTITREIHTENSIPCVICTEELPEVIFGVCHSNGSHLIGMQNTEENIKLVQNIEWGLGKPNKGIFYWADLGDLLYEIEGQQE
jgi:hypothetical protein